MKTKILFIIVCLVTSVFWYVQAQGAESASFSTVSMGLDTADTTRSRSHWHHASTTSSGTHDAEPAIVYTAYDSTSGCDQIFVRNLKKPDVPPTQVTKSCVAGQMNKLDPVFGPYYPDNYFDFNNDGTLGLGEQVEGSWSIIYAVEKDVRTAGGEPCVDATGCNLYIVFIGPTLTKAAIENYVANFDTSHGGYSPEFQLTDTTLPTYDRKPQFNHVKYDETSTGVGATYESYIVFERHADGTSASKNRDMIYTLEYGQKASRSIVAVPAKRIHESNKTYRFSGNCPSGTNGIPDYTYFSQSPQWDSDGENIVFTTFLEGGTGSYQIATVYYKESGLSTMSTTTYYACAKLSYTGNPDITVTPFSTTIAPATSLEIWTEDNPNVAMDRELPHFSPDTIEDDAVHAQSAILYHQKFVDGSGNTKYQLSTITVGKPLTGTDFVDQYVSAYDSAGTSGGSFPAFEETITVFASPHHNDPADASRRRPVWAPAERVLGPAKSTGFWIAYERLDRNNYWQTFITQINPSTISYTAAAASLFYFDQLPIKEAPLEIGPRMAQASLPELNKTDALPKSLNKAEADPTSPGVRPVKNKAGVFEVIDDMGKRIRYQVVSMKDGSKVEDSEIINSLKERVLQNDPKLSVQAYPLYKGGQKQNSNVIMIKSKDLQNFSVLSIQPMVSKKSLSPSSKDILDGLTGFLVVALQQREFQVTADCDDHFLWPEFNNAGVNLEADDFTDSAALATYLSTWPTSPITSDDFPPDLANLRLVDASAYDATLDTSDGGYTRTDNVEMFVYDLSGVVTDTTPPINGDDEIDYETIYDSCAPPSKPNEYTYTCDDGMLHLDVDHKAGTGVLSLVNATTGMITNKLTYTADFEHALAVQPVTEKVYSIIDLLSTAGTFALVILKPDGTVTTVGPLLDALSNAVIGDMPALGFGADGTLYVIETTTKTLYTIDPGTGSVTPLKQYTFPPKITWFGGDLDVIGDELIYTNSDGTVYSIDRGDPNYPLTGIGAYSSGSFYISAASYNGKHYAWDAKNDYFHHYDINPSFTPDAGAVAGPFEEGDGASCPEKAKPDRPDRPEDCKPVLHPEITDLTQDLDGDGYPDRCDTCYAEEDAANYNPDGLPPPDYGWYPYFDESGNGYCEDEVEEDCEDCCCCCCGDITITIDNTNDNTNTNTNEIINEINIDLGDYWLPATTTTTTEEAAATETPTTTDLGVTPTDQETCEEGGGTWTQEISADGSPSYDEDGTPKEICFGYQMIGGCGCTVVDKSVVTLSSMLNLALAILFITMPIIFLRRRSVMVRSK